MYDATSYDNDDWQELPPNPARERWEALRRNTDSDSEMDLSLVRRVGSAERCERTFRAAVHVGEGLYTNIEIEECGDWCCAFCFPRRAADEAVKWASAFGQSCPMKMTVLSGEMIPIAGSDASFMGTREVEVPSWSTPHTYELYAYSQRQRATIIDRATRLGHKVLSVPQDNGTTWIITTLSGDDRQYVAPESLAGTIESALSGLPIRHHGQGDDRRIRANKYLQAGLVSEPQSPEEHRAQSKRDAREKERQDAIEDYMAERGDEAPEARFLDDGMVPQIERLGLVVSRRKNGRVLTWHMPSVEEHGQRVVNEFAAIWDGQRRIESPNLLRMLRITEAHQALDEAVAA